MPERFEIYTTVYKTAVYKYSYFAFLSFLWLTMLTRASVCAGNATV